MSKKEQRLLKAIKEITERKRLGKIVPCHALGIELLKTGISREDVVIGAALLESQGLVVSGPTINDKYYRLVEEPVTNEREDEYV